MSRLREHPDQRFAADYQQFDLAVAAAQLRQEHQSGEGGHRQKSLYKVGTTSVALYLFERLTRLPRHRADGVICYQVLTGHLQVVAQDQAHDLHAGSLLILAPGVEHDVVAQEESEALVTVNLQTESIAAPPHGSQAGPG